MIPRLFTIGPIPVNSFGLMVALAIIATIFRLAQSFERAGIDPMLAEKYALWGGMVGLLGARVWYILENFQVLRSDIFGAIFSGSGFTFYGGFIFSFCLLVTFSIRDKIGAARFLDAIGPALCLAYAIGRLGCQLSGDGDYGVQTTSIFGMSYETGVVPTPHGILAYPSPFFESALALIVLAVLTRIEQHKLLQKPFSRFGAYLAMMGIERFMVEFLRINPKIIFGLSEAQVIALCLIAAGVILLIRPVTNVKMAGA